jgi:hypothetical protein
MLGIVRVNRQNQPFPSEVTRLANRQDRAVMPGGGLGISEFFLISRNLTKSLKISNAILRLIVSFQTRRTAMTRPNDDRNAFRCRIPPENSAAKLKFGRRLVNVCVLDTSRSGFSVRLPNKIARKLNNRKRAVLYFAGEKWEVTAKSSYTGTDDFTVVGLSRIRELTKIDQPASWGFTFLPKTNLQNDPAFLMYLMLAFVVAVICLPGVGDNLGTAPKVRKGLNNVVQSITHTMN